MKLNSLSSSYYSLQAIVTYIHDIIQLFIFQEKQKYLKWL